MEIALRTDIGQKRSENQDFINQFSNKSGITLIILADGMGGHRAGNIASELTVTDLGKIWEETDFSDLSQIRDWMIDVIEKENQKIHELGKEESYRGMGTTIEAVAVVGNAVLYAHLGDSRIGLVRNGQYQQLTTDHSLVNELLRAGQITEEEAAIHPQKNIITQSIGQQSPIELDLGVQQLEPGDFILMNSDGLTNMISNETVVNVLLADDESLPEKANQLVAQANKAGGLDNITVGLLHVEGEAAL
ncbi:Stp1/IreP family PP2C-type Ser/Thr phosphatase [Streptococcus tangpeifui]|uniref:Stp1/IreP family PP2C-type Ser/Thr phosphatase n=1 Tax=Streptococcus tangpeifui TaxID=2709400 RepID=UPI0013EBD848|nr:Stp1/IreP family PP2C-type Ser/Thr phosphatase [Streptococcus sp. ZJ373]